MNDQSAGCFAKVLFLGNVPPPYGGVSIYTMRLSERLKDKPFFLFIHPNREKNKLTFFKIFKYIRSNNIRVLHLNGLIKGMAAFRYYILKLITGVGIIVTYHNARFLSLYHSLGFIERFFCRLFFKNVDILITSIDKADYLFVDGERIVRITPFLAPSKSEVEAQLPESMYSFRKEHNILLTANASKIAIHENEDLYGLDLTIELTRLLCDYMDSSVGLVFVVAGEGNEDYILKMRKRIKEYGIADDFLLWQQPVSFPALLDLCDIYVRPTNTDSFGISIQEALYLGKPSIASNVCERPQGTIIFRNRDIEDLTEKTLYVIENYQSERLKVLSLENPEGTTELCDIYDSFLCTGPASRKV